MDKIADRYRWHIVNILAHLAAHHTNKQLQFGTYQPTAMATDKNHIAAMQSRYLQYLPPPAQPVPGGGAAGAPGNQLVGGGAAALGGLDSDSDSDSDT